MLITSIKLINDRKYPLAIGDETVEKHQHHGFGHVLP